MPAILSLAALLAGTSILLVGNGLQGLLIPVRADIEGFSTASIGIIAAAYSIGFIFGCVINPRVIKRVGHIRSFSIFAAIGAAIMLCHALVLNEQIWFALRLMSGICFSGLMTVVESWLNEKSTKDTRGQVFGLYLFVNLSSITTGMLLLVLGDPAAFDLFALTAIAILLGLVPVCLTTTKAPTPIAEVKLRPVRLFRLSPVGVFGCFGVGMANGAFTGLSPVFANQLGMSTGAIAFFSAGAVIGGAIGQYPIGRLSDSFDRRTIIIGACIGALLAEFSLAGVALEWFAADWDLASRQFLLVGLSCFLGVFIFPLYGLSVAHTNDFAEDTDFVEVTSELLLTWGIGASLGPILGSTLMGAMGPPGLFVWLAFAHLLLAMFAAYRMAQRAAPASDDKASYAPAFGQRATPTSYGLHPQADGLGNQEESS